MLAAWVFAINAMHALRDSSGSPLAEQADSHAGVLAERAISDDDAASEQAEAVPDMSSPEMHVGAGESAPGLPAPVTVTSDGRAPVTLGSDRLAPVTIASARLAHIDGDAPSPAIVAAGDEPAANGAPDAGARPPRNPPATAAVPLPRPRPALGAAVPGGRVLTESEVQRHAVY